MTTPVLAVLRDGGPQLADPDEPVVQAGDLGLLRGEGVFETLRVLDRRPVDLAAHLDRLARSAAALELALPPATELAALAALGISAWPGQDAVLRLVATKGGDGVDPVRLALLTDVPAGLPDLRRRGIGVITLALGVPAGLRGQAPWLLGGVKCTSYAVPMAAQRAALAAGAEDALWVSSDGQLLEAPTSTVLVALDGGLCTPPAGEVGVLAGTTLAAVRRLVPVADRHVSVAELASAAEVLLVSSVRGAVPVTSIDGRPLPVGPHGRHLPEALEAHLRSLR